MSETGVIAQARAQPRLAIIARLYPRPYNPHAGPFNRQQFRRLAQHYRLSLLVPVPWNEWIRHRAELGPTRVDGLRVRYASWWFLPKLASSLYPLWFALSLWPLLRWLRAAEPECLLVSWAYPDAVGGVALARALGCPLIIRTHGSDVNVYAAGRLPAAQLRWATQHAAFVICVSHALKRSLVELGVEPDKVAVIPTGVDTERFAPRARDGARRQLGLAGDRRILLFVGNLLRAKGLHELVEAFSALAARRPELDLVLVGQGPERAWLDAQAARLGLAHRIRAVGAVDHEAVATWLNAADLFCLPSHREGLPNGVVEALACGLPVVATDVGGIPEALTPDNGILVRPHSGSELASALQQALDREWDRDAIVASGRRFSWDANLSATRRLIDQAIALHRQGRSR